MSWRSKPPDSYFINIFRLFTTIYSRNTSELKLLVPLSSFSFKTDPSEGSYDETPVHMPLSPDLYIMNIELDVVHNGPIYVNHPKDDASPTGHIPPDPAAPILAAYSGHSRIDD
ncbi:hypothetical protein Rs2_16159 [Raphanus sativus]|nr:hypothetical protein Rs2_16159 [Raphanus sativus]